MPPDGALPPAMRVGDEVSYVASITTRKSWLPWRSGQEIQRGTAVIGWSLLAERGEHGLSWTLMRTDIDRHKYRAAWRACRWDIVGPTHPNGTPIRPVARKRS